MSNIQLQIVEFHSHKSPLYVPPSFLYSQFHAKTPDVSGDYSVGSRKTDCSVRADAESTPCGIRQRKASKKGPNQLNATELKVSGDLSEIWREASDLVTGIKWGLRQTLTRS